MTLYKIQYRPENMKLWRDDKIYKSLSQNEARDVLSNYAGFSAGTMTAHTFRKDGIKVFLCATPET